MEPEKVLNVYPESYVREFLKAALMPPYWVQEMLKGLGGEKQGNG